MGQVSAAHCTAALSSPVVCCHLLQGTYDACILRLHLLLYWVVSTLKSCRLLLGSSAVCTQRCSGCCAGQFELCGTP